MTFQYFYYLYIYCGTLKGRIVLAEWFEENFNFPTLLVCFIIAVCLFFAIRYIIKNRHNGCCGGDCENCLNCEKCENKNKSKKSDV